MNTYRIRISTKSGNTVDTGVCAKSFDDAQDIISSAIASPGSVISFTSAVMSSSEISFVLFIGIVLNAEPTT